MVVEELFKTRWAEKRPAYSVFLGVILTIIAFITSYALFRQTPHFIGISTILFIVILVIPTVNKLFDREEKLEVKEKLSFFVKHEHIIDFFIYFFIGVFIVLFVIALIVPHMVFSEQQLYNIQSNVQKKVDVQKEEGGRIRHLPPPPPFGTKKDEMVRIFKNNMYVMVIAFILSVFYGTGALFLITLNASIFAFALANVVRIYLPSAGFLSAYSFTLCNLGIMFFHMIPEVAGYLLAAIAGGVLSHAFLREKIGGKNFRIVLLDSIVLLIAAIVILVMAAIIEIQISKKLFTENVCIESQFVVILITILVVIGIIVFEFIRKTKHTGKKLTAKKSKKLK
ncbi:hypothetical protein CMO93_03355 [Candidatus Woesearchaeota archaeon]|nr:hypothetical protein [Candidatus Woesearchaeota archaeon]|tara:strand:- start:739 stop:1755 length:1017 start_codon:yes stop_codon:yes gene_type:complete